MAIDLKRLDRRVEDMKPVRQQREGEWQQIADFFLPAKNFNIETIKGQGVPRKVMTTVPQVELAKYQALSFGYLIDPTRPCITANIDHGLRRAGRLIKPDKADLDYIDDLQWAMHSSMMLPRSGFMGSVSRAMLELGGFGNAVIWTGRKRGYGPRYMARPMRACWWDVDDEDIVNRLFFEFSLTLEDVFERWGPQAKKCEELMRLYGDEKNWTRKVKLRHFIEPRSGGERGGHGMNKPFAEVIYAYEYKNAILHEWGYDGFPYAVPRLNVVEGNPYGQGPAWRALPAAIMLNRLQDLVEFGVGQRVAPSAFMPARLFGGKKPSLNPAAINYYDPKMFGGFAKLADMVQYWPQGGDVGIGVDYMGWLSQQIADAFNMEVLKLREAGNVTAEEVLYRKRVNMAGQTGLLTSVDRDMFGPMGDRTFDVMEEEGLIAAPTPNLAGIEIDWEFAGPLAIARQQNQAEAIAQLITQAQQAMTVDPDSVTILSLSEGLRMSAEALAAPPSMIRSRAEYDAIIAQRAQERQDTQEAAMATQGAQAMRDASQGAASLAQAGVSSPAAVAA